MRKAILIMCLFVAALTSARSQTTDNYVVQIMEHKEIVYLYVNPLTYGQLSEIGKNTLIERETKELNVKHFYVINGHSGELWQKTNGSVKLVDSWNMDKPSSTLTPVHTPSKSRSLQHPWFFNISGAFGMAVPKSSPTTITFSGYGRIGCYLLNDRWDLALNGLIGYNKIVSISDNINEDFFNGSIGVDTRGYVLKGKAVNPFVGMGLSYASSNGESSFTIPVSVGMSIPILGKSCLDVCYQYNKVTKSAIIVGYTYMR